MIQELVEFGKRVTVDKNRAFKEEHYSITLVIDKEGQYQQFIVGERQSIEAEVITAKKGKARFLLDKSEEVLGISVVVDKLEAFQKRLEPFKEVESLKPVFKFYDKQNPNGLRKAIIEYLNLSDGYKDGNITFMVDSTILLAMEEVQEAINKHIQEQEQTKTKESEDLSAKKTPYTTAIVIDENGEFQGFVVNDNQSVRTKPIFVKKKESYLLLGRCEDVLGITEAGVDKKHKLFLDKLLQYKKDLHSIEPVFKFYKDGNGNGIKKAISESVIKFRKDSTEENITFMLMGESVLLRNDEVRAAIIKHFNENEQKLSNGKICSICGKSDSPVLDEPHGLVKMPKGQSAGSALVSYNAKAFESYGLIGNLNSSICRECARNYIDGLSFLLSYGHMVENKENDKKKSYYHHKHRINISDTTVALFWTKQETEEVNPFMIYDEPNEVEVRNLFTSVLNGDSSISSVVESNMFYSLTLSSAAARIAVRDWTAISLEVYKCNLADWFQDIEIQDYNGKLIYSPLRLLINAFQRRKKQGERAKSDLVSKARIGSILWNAAIKGRSYKIPLEILQSVLNRIYVEGEFSPYRAAIIKLIINRNTNKNMKSHLDESNRSIAYMCGRLFAVIESMQWKAIGNVNSGIKERFFAATVSQPAYVLGSLLTKNVPIYQHKIGGYLAKELDEIAGIISERGSFPQRFTLIEQGEFALGYYFQRTHKVNNEKLGNANS